MKKEETWKTRMGEAQIESCVEYLTSGLSPAEIVSMNLCLRMAQSEQVDELFSFRGND